MKHLFLRYRHHPWSLTFRLLVGLGALVTGGLILGLVGYILVTGLPALRPSLFALHWTTENQSLMPALLSTLVMTLLSLLLALPVGVGGAIYLSEYARPGSPLVSLVRLTAETLQGIPSIVYGLFGFVLFHVALGWGFSLLSGALTLGLMILPLILRTTEEALLSVPAAYREGSFGLGAGQVRTVFQIVLPTAMPGILSGVLLSIGRILGESAALLYTAGTGTGSLSFWEEGRFSLTAPLFQSTRTLSVHLYCLITEGLHTEEAQATALVLLLLVAALGALATWSAGRLSRK